MSAVPKALRNMLAALVIAAGGGSGLYVALQPGDAPTEATLEDPYIQAVAHDSSTSDAVKLAMVMGYHFESGGKHIGKPYVDKMAASKPLTVCGGLTAATIGPIDPSHYYTEAECYQLTVKVYRASEAEARRLLTRWSTYGPYQRAVFIDFVHHFGAGQLTTSTMRRLANAGDLDAACRENPRWKMAAGIVWPGLQARANAREEFCSSW